MKKYKTLFSFSFRKCGSDLYVFDDDNHLPIFIGCNNRTDAADGCRVLASFLLEMAHNLEHAKDFCYPDFDEEHREKQIDELRKTIRSMYEDE